MPNPELLGFLDDLKLDVSITDELDHAMRNSSPEQFTVGGGSGNIGGVDLRAIYCTLPVAHPFGKAAGQLSMTSGHVKSDFENGLGFTVLKSAVGITEGGDVGIDEWGKSAPKMVVGKRRSKDKRDGWTVTWKGRGWDKGFKGYLDFYREALRVDANYPVIPSLMVDVTNRDRAKEQADYCLGELAGIFREAGGDLGLLPFIEIDISPTLNLLPGAGDDENFKSFVTHSVEAFTNSSDGTFKLAVKIPNANRGPEFQVSLVKASIEAGKDRIAGIIIGNRLFDPDREFKGQQGIAYGGWDLSNANLDTLDLLVSERINIPLIATGNICSGKMMVEYGLRGCLAGEIHTFFQLPSDAYRAPKGEGGRVWRALRELVYHPEDGLIAVMLKLEKVGLVGRKTDDHHNNQLYFLDLPTVYDKIRTSGNRNGYSPFLL